MKKAISLFLALVMLVSVFAGLGITAYAADAQTLWVDPVNGSDSAAGTQVAPFQTIEKAKAAAAALSAGGDVTVWLHGGTYRVSNAITFTSADSGKNGHVITYKAVSGEVPVISGGTPITGWTIYDAQKNIYVADVPAAAVNSRQFYVDGEHQTRAMTEQSPTDWTLFGTKGYMSPAVTTQEANEYLVLDLGKVRSVNYLTAYSSIQADKNGRAAGFPQDFTVETSEDGTAWTVQCEQTGYESPVVATAATFNFAPAQARYITILYRYAENKGYNVSKSASLDSFTDGSAVSAYARPAMQWAVGMNFLSGNTLTPGAPASRAQIAQVLMLFCKAYIK